MRFFRLILKMLLFPFSLALKLFIYPFRKRSKVGLYTSGAPSYSNPYSAGRPHKYNPISNEGTKPKNQKGEYTIYDNAGNRKYQGISSDLVRRMCEHKRTGKINSTDTIFSYKYANPDASYNDMRKHESKKIKQHNPPDNKRGGGGGRPPT